MITLKQYPTHLEIILNDKEEFLERYPDLMPEPCDILEDSRYLGNGWSDLTGQVGLTDSPIIGYDISIDEEGNPEIDDNSTIYFFPNYMMINPFEVLYKTGNVKFTKVK
jgi:hypothetical protein